MVPDRFDVEKLSEVVRSVFKLCSRLRLRGAVIGAAAVDSWGHARGTQDFDLLVDFQPEDVHRIKESLSSVGGTLDAQWERSYPAEDRMIRFRVAGIQVDWIRPLLPLSREALARRKRKRCYGAEAWVVSLVDLLLLKLQLGRPRDIDDVVALLVAHHELLESPTLLEEVKQLHLGREWKVVSDRVREALRDPLA